MSDCFFWLAAPGLCSLKLRWRTRRMIKPSRDTHARARAHTHTQHTLQVSLDFRVVPGSCYDPDPPESRFSSLPHSLTSTLPLPLPLSLSPSPPPPFTLSGCTLKSRDLSLLRRWLTAANRAHGRLYKKLCKCFHMAHVDLRAASRLFCRCSCLCTDPSKARPCGKTVRRRPGPLLRLRHLMRWASGRVQQQQALCCLPPPSPTCLHGAVLGCRGHAAKHLRSICLIRCRVRARLASIESRDRAGL